MQLSQKQKTFSIFLEFLKSRLNAEHIWKKGDFHNWFISEITDCEKRG